LDFIPKDQYRLTLNRRMGYEYFVSHPSMKFILTGQANGLNELLNALHKKHPEGLYFAWSDLERFLKEARTAGDNEFADNFIKLFRKKDDLESPLYKEQTCRAVVASLRDSTTL